MSGLINYPSLPTLSDKLRVHVCLAHCIASIGELAAAGDIERVGHGLLVLCVLDWELI